MLIQRNIMTLPELKQEILTLVNDYIENANRFQNPSFAFMRHFTNPYRNLEKARKLKTACEDQSSSNQDFISKIHDICQTIQCSSNLLPKITLKIVDSKLFSRASAVYYEIENNISSANAHNDGGGITRWTTDDYISVLECAARTESIQMEMLPTTNARASR